MPSANPKPINRYATQNAHAQKHKKSRRRGQRGRSERASGLSRNVYENDYKYNTKAAKTSKKSKVDCIDFEIPANPGQTKNKKSLFQDIA